jgi:hypothetical protein
MTELAQQSAVTIALLAVCLIGVVTVVAVSAHAYRQGRLLRRWNNRNRQEPLSARLPRRRRATLAGAAGGVIEA